MNVFLDPQNDYVFKRIFGNENAPQVLLSFLNATMHLSGDRCIDQVTVLNPYQAPHIKAAKETILDIRCRDQSGHQYIVEMQVLPQASFDKRVLYYASKSYTLQLERSKNYTHLRKVFFLGVLGFPFSTGNSYISAHHILNVETRERTLQDFEFIFVELPKFNKKETELSSMADKWAYFLRYAADLKEIPKALMNEPDIVTAFEIARESGWSKDELLVYDYVAMRKMDEEAIEEHGFQQGEKAGLEKGKLEGRLEVARNLMAQSIPLSIVAEVTKL
jgi:predicted transposase/invertase (TIGR01784 family)